METLNQEFLNDYNSLSNEEFIKKYKREFNYYTQTQIKGNPNESFINIDNENFFELICSWTHTLEGKRYQVFEDENLLQNAIQLKHINNDITRECLIFALYKIYPLEEHKEDILNAVDYVFNNGTTPQPTTRKTDVISNKEYIFWQGLHLDGLDKWRIAYKDSYFADLHKFYDNGLSIEENLDNFNKLRKVNVTLQTFKKYLESAGIIGVSKAKQKKNDSDQEIKNIIKTHSNKSERDLVKICANLGFKVSKTKIHNLKVKIQSEI